MWRFVLIFGVAGELWLVWERFCAARSCMVWYGWSGGARHCGVWLGDVRRGKAGKVGNGCVSYGELSSGLLRYGMAGKARLG